jgi:hypothetical protein
MFYLRHGSVVSMRQADFEMSLWPRAGTRRAGGVMNLVVILSARMLAKPNI